MKTALYGRIVFGASAVLFGVIALMWYDSETWQTLRQIWSLPFGTIIGGCLMIVQIAGGIGIEYPRTAHLASIAVCVIYMVFSLVCIPGIIAAPTVYVHYGPRHVGRARDGRMRPLDEGPRHRSSRRVHAGGRGVLVARCHIDLYE